jgi:hypothetical protein
MPLRIQWIFRGHTKKQSNLLFAYQTGDRPGKSVKEAEKTEENCRGNRGKRDFLVKMLPAVLDSPRSLVVFYLF